MFETLLLVFIIIFSFVFFVVPLALFIFMIWFEWSERHLPKKKK